MNSLQSDQGPWQLDPEVVFLNHGSFGATPTKVLEAQQTFRDRMELEPVRFLVRELPKLMESAREILGTFIGADPEGIAFVPNATTGLNSVSRYFPMETGDEILTIDQTYNANRNIFHQLATERGAAIKIVDLPFPKTSAAQIEAAILEGVGPRTRLAILDHITSATALEIPLATLVPTLESQGVRCAIDGAHAPGQIALAVEDLGASWYVGNLHKWVCAPKGSAFLWTRKDHREHTRPVVISHGANAPLGTTNRYRLEFDWMGTQDPSPHLCVPLALSFIASRHPEGWPGVRERNRQLARWGRRLIEDALGEPALADEELFHSLGIIKIGANAHAELSGPFDIDPLQDHLFHDFGIEIPVMPAPKGVDRVLRISAHLHNGPEDYEALKTALLTIKNSPQGSRFFGPSLG